MLAVAALVLTSMMLSLGRRQVMMSPNWATIRTPAGIKVTSVSRMIAWTSAGPVASTSSQSSGSMTPVNQSAGLGPADSCERRCLADRCLRLLRFRRHLVLLGGGRDAGASELGLRGGAGLGRYLVGDPWSTVAGTVAGDDSKLVLGSVGEARDGRGRRGRRRQRRARPGWRRRRYRVAG